MFKKREKNEEISFKAAYEEYRVKIYRHLAYITGDNQAAEDLAQEVFMKLYNSPPEHDNTIAWLFRVANNLAYNYLRRERTRMSKEPVAIEIDYEKVVSIEDAAIRNQEVRKTRRVLELLPERDRMCLLLKFSGYKYGEIAKIIGVADSSVGTILARAQKKFMERYLKEV